MKLPPSDAIAFPFAKSVGDKFVPTMAVGAAVGDAVVGFCVGLEVGTAVGSCEVGACVAIVGT